MKLSVNRNIWNSPIIRGSRISVNTSMRKCYKMPDLVDIISLPNLLCSVFSPRKRLYEIIGEQDFLIFTDNKGFVNIGEYLCKQQAHEVDITRILTLFFHREKGKCEFSVKNSKLCQPKTRNYYKSPILIQKNRP